MYKLAYGILALVIYNTAFTMDNEAYLQKYHELNDEFVAAVQENDLGKVKEFLKMKTSVCARDMQGNDLLFFAVQNKNKEMADLLISKIDRKMMTLEGSVFYCFQDEARNNNTEAIIMLMDSPHMPVQLKPEAMRSAFTIACTSNFSLMAEELIQTYTDYIVNPSANLKYAIINGFTDIVRIILTHPNANPFETSFNDTKTPLMYAQEQKNDAMIDLLEKAQRDYIRKLRFKKTAIENEIKTLKRLSQAE